MKWYEGKCKKERAVLFIKRFSPLPKEARHSQISSTLVLKARRTSPKYQRYCAKVDSFEQFDGRTALNQPDKNSAPVNKTWNQMGCEEKTARVHQEISRMNKLPANSSYAGHRLRVLNKILQLLSIQELEVSSDGIIHTMRMWLSGKPNDVTGGGVGIAVCWAVHLKKLAEWLNYPVVKMFNMKLRSQTSKPEEERVSRERPMGLVQRSDVTISMRSRIDGRVTWEPRNMAIKFEKEEFTQTSFATLYPKETCMVSSTSSEHML
ncbi:hypothetical protein M9H77_22025 [Catharanthus roseus]|uniref:Uncharacterized protein n=1 Tax=Catharanthus roseus TaxID=4058 RepID=A0ACC0ART6_CATRO|nr:hypothetical protein M9H77_22025 [Catharanthus roseus]